MGIKEIIKAILDSFSKPGESKEDYWNNRWTKNQVVYKAQGTLMKDPRNLIFNKSHVLKQTAFQLAGKTDEETAMNVLNWVHKNCKYVGDITVHNTAEYWQDPEETFQRLTGDCEDGALLILSLMRIAGVPAYRVKLCAGNVEYNNGTTGHAYVIFLRDDDTWCILDWCYYYDPTEIKLRMQHKDDKRYKSIWWTCNDEFTWAQSNTIIGESTSVKSRRKK